MQQEDTLTYLLHCAIDGDKELGLNKLGVSRVLAFAICRPSAVASSANAGVNDSPGVYTHR